MYKFKEEDLLKDKGPSRQVLQALGTTKNNLTAIEYVGYIIRPTDNSKRNLYIRCQCKCGNEKITTLNAFNTGSTKSCGCLLETVHYKKGHKIHQTHGKSHLRAYGVYCGMISRCYKEKMDNYPRYGGAGIKVCDRWLESFENFYKDMGDPSPGYTIDRINGYGNYEPNNCRWATNQEQARNKKSNILIKHNGEIKSAAEWGRTVGLSKSVVYDRLQRGWDIERVLITPTTYKKQLLAYDLNGNFIKEYNSVTSAAFDVGTSVAAISSCLKGKTKTCAGYTWKYKD